MSSVWKRLQRVGKKASKFQFTATYQSLTVECIRGGKWQPNKLIVVWTRRKRRKVSKPMSWQPGISNPFRGIIVWPEPEPVDITVTLYKDSKPGSQFEDKEWTFVIEDESQNGRRKPIASGAINMVDYASVEYRTFDVELTLKLSKKEVVSGSLDFTLSCVLIKEGMATDEDMISIGSMLSLNENYYLNDNDEDMEVPVAPSPKPRHKRNLSQGNIKVPAVSAVQNSDGFTTESPSASPVPGAERRKRGRIRSKSALGENTKTLTSELQKEELKRLSTGSDTSFDTSDARELTRDKSKMESELIKWARSRTKGYKGVKVKNMTTCWKDGLAFCAILHSFHPDKIDFASLDPLKVKQNNKLAFSAFEKLGIPRLLEPAQMMLTSVPDKLSVMTYVYQIKAHFCRQPAASLSSKKPGIRKLKQFRFAEEELEPSEKAVDISGVDMVVAPSCSSDDTRKKDSADEGRGEGVDQAIEEPSGERDNPFLDNEESVKEAASVDTSESGTSEMQRKESNDAEEQPSILVEKYSKEEVLDQEPSSRSKDDPVKSELRAPPKPPRLYLDKEHLAAGHTECKLTDDTRTVSSKELNPFENSVDKIAFTSDTNQEPEPAKDPSEGYNPFDEDDSMENESQGKPSDTVVEQTKEGYNPFDDDDDDEAEEGKGEKGVDKKSSKEKSGGMKRTVSYPHGFNPFDEDVASDSVAVKPKEIVPNKKAQLSNVKNYNPFDDDDEGIENQNTKDTAVSTSKSYNPFDDDDDDDVGDNGDLANQTSESRSKTAAGISSREKELKLAKPRVTSPSELPKPKDGNVKKRRAPPPPTARPSDDPWTAKLPDDRRRRPVKPAKTEQSLLPSSPAKTRAKRPAPAPPRRPPLIPSFDECKATASTDRSITGTNERSRQASGVGTDGAPKEPRVTSRPSTPNRRSPVAGKKTSGGEDGTNSADIKILARQVLMDARKKAGASGSLPRERVAKITKEREGEEGSIATKESPNISQRRRSTESDSKGQSLERLATDGTSGTNNASQEKSKEENQEAATKRANLKQRKEELQRRKKASEKAQKMVQNAIAKEKADKASTVSELPEVEQIAITSPTNEILKYEDEKSESSDDGSDKKAAGKINLQRRPLKLKDKESAGSSTETSERKPFTGKDAEPEKTGFQESEELQRIRAILNQGKSTGADSKKQQAQIPEGSREVTRKSSDTKPSDYKAVNGESVSRNPKPLPRNKVRGPNAGLEAYVESRKMNFEGFQIPSAQTPRDNHIDRTLDTEISKDDNDEDKTVDGKDMDEENQSLNSEDQESLNQSPEFQDKYEYVCQELKSLEEEQEALDRVGVKLETELRRAMHCKGCEEEQERLMQDWFLLVSKKNDLVRRQEELNLMKNEEDLDRQHVMLQRELRALMDLKECQKTDEQRTREQQLIQELVRVVNQRDELVQFEDTQQQQAEEDALHLQKMIDNVRVPKDKNDCVLQ